MEFKLGSIPVRVRGQFFLTALFLRMNERNPAKIAAWIGIVFVSVLVHELGHALAGKAFGLAPQIELYGLGGLTSFGTERWRSIGRWRSVVISLAGPFAGFLLGGAVLAANRAGLRLPDVGSIIWVNIGWGIFNLLPMLPLDGGNVVRALTSEKIARIASIPVGVALVALALRSQQWWIVVLVGLYTFQNVQALRYAKQNQIDHGLATIIEQAHAALQRDAPKEAIALLSPALATSATADLRQVGLRLYVVALLKDAQWSLALDVITRERETIGNEDLSRYAHTLRELGRAEDAERVSALVKAPPRLSEFRT
jgi:Zn-dependent protease